MLIGTAGHIDHGKTSLVRALTGVDADRLPEEKQRGITLDLGYAYRPLADGSILGFIDMPGHERLIRNMLAGAKAIDFALLVIAADDGPMPQTREHLELLDLIGIDQAAVAITKTDTVEPARLAEVQSEVAALLAGTTLADSPIFACSVRSGAGVDALRDHLESRAAVFEPPPASGGFRLAIDRQFSIAGTGTVVTGTVVAGRVAVGDALTLAPYGSQGARVQVRGLRVQDQPAEVGQVGERCAVALRGA